MGNDHQGQHRQTLTLSAEAKVKILGPLTLGPCASIAQGVGTLRTKSGATHGRGLGNALLAPRHARLAVNAAATVGLFLLETPLTAPG